MIHKPDIIKIAKHVLRRQQGVSDPHIMHPERDWVVGIVVAILIFIIAAYISIQSYLDHRDVDAFSNSLEQDSAIVYRESLVKEVLEKFSKKESVLNEIKGIKREVPVVEVVATTTEEVVEEAVVEELPAISAESE